MLLTGRTLDADEAQQWGLITRVVAHEEVLEAARVAMGECRQMAPQARTAVKRGVNGAYPRYDRMSMDLSLSGP